ncbi:hypothetical protein CTAYLR_003809 [Chrysophaeum taylorii]|uniref:protein O-GlcNAc transferase n=1 Tax=Chrysophaeum taylorii TaxID=2483200 RepID=A0AAD7UEE5_9STRA|nr:hypothetical protein CTAYLR_003809 [Chrysophaeum taylorii]
MGGANNALFFFFSFLVFVADASIEEIRAAAMVHARDPGAADEVYRRYLDEFPDAMHLHGLVLHGAGETARGVGFIEKALEIRWDPTFLSNLGELKRSIGDLDGAIAALQGACPPECRNLAVASREAERWDLLEVASRHEKNRLDLGDALQKQRKFEQAEIVFGDVVEEGVDDVDRALVGWGVTAQQTGRLDVAAERYRRITNSSSPAGHQALVNLATISHERGDLDAAIASYESILRTRPDDAQALNNLGAALVTIGRHDEAVRVLERCGGQQPQALTNLAMHFANEGELGKAREHLRRARKRDKNNAGLVIREVTMMAPMATTTIELCLERVALAIRVAAALKNFSATLVNPVSSVEQIHFYLPYGGFVDRPLQEAIANLYRKLSPELQFFTRVKAQRPAKKRRVGFCSKFFGSFEPHGLLLEGVVKYLPRDKFRVVLLPVASPGRQASDFLLNATDELILLGLNFYENRGLIANAELDILVYADMLSEPMTYFLGFSRLASVQVVFWGNPVTSGRHEIDFFVSADRMEIEENLVHSCHYTEQVVLLGGQGIWYRKPSPPHHPSPPQNEDNKNALRFLLPQSNFKIHPEFDKIILEILRRRRRTDEVEIVVTEGRRERWTNILKKRLPGAKFVPRAKPSEFANFVSSFDLLLHPFPFGGSRTSSDGLAAGVPVLTRPTGSLRGRMAASFYETMGLTDPKWSLVARSSEEYVEFAIRLTNRTHLREVTRAVRERSHLIWERMEVVEEWSKFLARVPLLSHRDLYDSGNLVAAKKSMEPFVSDDLLIDYGAILQQLGEYEAAEAALRKSLALNPTNQIALNNLAVTLHESGRLAEARVVYQQTSGDVALYNAANALRDAGDVPAAIAKLREVLGDDDPIPFLFEPANHRPFFDNSYILSRNSLVVMEGTSLKIPETIESPPTDDELDPFGGGGGGGAYEKSLVLFHLIVQPFGGGGRKDDVLAVLAHNRNQPFLKVHCLVEKNESFVQDFVVIGRRLRFSDASIYARKYLPRDALVVIANADIAFDESIKRLTPLYLQDTVVALAPWESKHVFRPRVDSQDAWVFSNRNSRLFDVDVEIGRPRCDNFIAAHLRKHVRLASPSLAVRALHYHQKNRSSIHTYASPTEIKGPSAYVRLTDQWLF